MKKYSNIFKSLSDTNRLRILKMLSQKPLCVCEITEVLALANSTVSQHLSILKKDGFIFEERNGKWINYAPNHKSTDSRIIAILTSLDFWIGELEVVEKDRVKVKTVSRNIVCKA